MVRLALYQPDIPQNTGTIMRLAACLGVGLDVIGPLGFVWDEKRMRRAGMDYREIAAVTKHSSWETFQSNRTGRLVLLTTRAALPFNDFAFSDDDVLLLGRESAGVPDEVHRAADARLLIPMVEPARSLNVAISAAIVVAEALRQTSSWPALPSP